jgi:D123
VTANDRFRALNYAHIYAMRSRTGTEALDLLCRSERIHADLDLALERPSQWTQKIVIREWMCIPLQFEFRGFVRNRSLNALSQYYHTCFYEDVHKHHQLCCDLITEFYATHIRHLIPIESCVCDFVVDLEHKRVLVVELNVCECERVNALVYVREREYVSVRACVRVSECLQEERERERERESTTARERVCVCE